MTNSGNPLYIHELMTSFTDAAKMYSSRFSLPHCPCAVCLCVCVSANYMNTKNNRKVDGRGDAVNIIVQTGRSLPLACTYTHTHIRKRNNNNYGND